MFPLLLAPSSPTLDSLDGFSTALNSPTLMSPTLPLSQIIANDAPLLSPTPVVDAYGQPLYSPALMDHYMPYNYAYGLPPSPPNSTGSNGSNSPVPLLRMRMSPDSMSASERDQLCLPTHQVFDFPEGHNPPSPESNSPSPQMARRSLSISSSVPSKRDLSPGPSVSKKARGLGERVTTKDFIPPDVSGLSKREARLVKNRAAAFLSRQRKREEFETMEMYVKFKLHSIVELFTHSKICLLPSACLTVGLLNLNKKIQHFGPLPKKGTALLRIQTLTTHFFPSLTSFALNWPLLENANANSVPSSNVKPKHSARRSR